METQICQVDAKYPQPELIAQAAQIIRGGGLVAFPTETVYGLGGNALAESASAKIYAAKGRPSDNPLIVHIADLETLPLVAARISEKASRLMDAFWPGPLTLIFEKTPAVPYTTTGGLDTVAVRMPAHEAALQLIRAAGVPVAAPSANASGRPSPTCAAHVATDLSGRIDLLLDGGSADIGVESTIVDMTVEPPMILRPGYITEEMLREIIGAVSVDPAIQGESTLRPKAPGMRYRHYAPKAPLTIVEEERASAHDAEGNAAVMKICALAAELGTDKRIGIIGTDESLAYYRAYGAPEQEAGWIVKSVGSRSDEAGIARNLYRVLREFDEETVDVIFSESFARDHLGQAIMNRLSKAAGQHVIKV